MVLHRLLRRLQRRCVERVALRSDGGGGQAEHQRGAIHEPRRSPAHDATAHRGAPGLYRLRQHAASRGRGAGILRHAAAPLCRAERSVGDFGRSSVGSGLYSLTSLRRRCEHELAPRLERERWRRAVPVRQQRRKARSRSQPVPDRVFLRSERGQRRYPPYESQSLERSAPASRVPGRADEFHFPASRQQAAARPRGGVARRQNQDQGRQGQGDRSRQRRRQGRVAAGDGFVHDEPGRTSGGTCGRELRFDRRLKNDSRRRRTVG